MTLTIRIIYPASQARFAAQPPGVVDLQQRRDCELSFATLPPSPEGEDPWLHSAGAPAERAALLAEALCDDALEVIWCGRGGYGCSDLLPLLPWGQLAACRHKWLIGFSDISCLASALYTRLQWPSIHGPMPGSTLWGQGGGEDIVRLLTLLGEPRKASTLPLEGLVAARSPQDVEGWLFGGCFSVLTNLIGTPYFPRSLAGAILFWEDVGENPGRLMRHLNQWLQSGVMHGVRAVVIGDLAELGSPHSQQRVKEEFARRLDVPVWSATSFGHIAPNYPLLVGAKARLVAAANRLDWHYAP